MEVHVQLKTADGSVAGSLKAAGLNLYPRYPGTQDSRQGTLFRVPVEDQTGADRALELLRSTDGVERAEIA